MFFFITLHGKFFLDKLTTFLNFLDQWFAFRYNIWNVNGFYTIYAKLNEFFVLYFFVCCSAFSFSVELCETIYYYSLMRFMD